MGSIRVFFDKSLQTNQKRKTHKFKDLCLGSAIGLHKGDLIGEFRMGSTIVVIFEAPLNFKFNIAQGQRILMGQSLGCVQKENRAIDRAQMRTVQAGR